MTPIPNYDAVMPSGDFEQLPAGGYVLKIQSAEDVKDKQYLSILFDIAEGDHKGRYSDEWGANHPYAHRLIKSYKEKALGLFKAFTVAVESSNPGYKWDWKEDKLAGKIFGAVLGYEEYESDRGEIRQRLYVKTVKPAEDIRAGKFTVPDLKKLTAATSQPSAGFEAINPEDVPF